MSEEFLDSIDILSESQTEIDPCEECIVGDAENQHEADNSIINNCPEGYTLQATIELNPETPKSLIAWVKAHKNQLVLAGLGITAIIAIILGIRNIDSLEALWQSLEESIKKVPVKDESDMSATATTISAVESLVPTRSYTSPTEPFDVSRHIRTMAAGKHHSAEKAAEAAVLGISLLPNQTIVDSYTKHAA